MTSSTPIPRKIRLLHTLALLALALCLPGCKDTHEKVLADQLTKIRELVDVLKSIRDEASARDAAPKLARIESDLKDLQTRMEKLGKPDENEEKRLADKFQDLARVQDQLSAESFRIALDPALSKVIQPALKNVQK